MNRSLTIKSLYMLSLLLMAQPAVHCFGLEQLKASLIQNFHHVKPYFTLDNVVKSALLGTIVGVFGFILYKAVKNPKANYDAVKSSQTVVKEPPKPVISLEEHAAQLIEVIT